MHSRLIFLHYYWFPMGGRFFEHPASYGYDVGASFSWSRQIRSAQERGASRALSFDGARGWEKDPRKASRDKPMVPVP